MRSEKSGNAIFHHWSSLRELTQTVHSLDDLQGIQGKLHSLIKDENKYERFNTGGSKVKDLRKRIDSGLATHDQMEKFKKAKNEIKAHKDYQDVKRTAKKRRKRKYAESGEELDIDRLLAGNPEHWAYHSRNNVKTIRIGVDIAKSGGANAREFVDLAAKVAAAVDIIEMTGVKVEMYCSMFFNNSIRKGKVRHFGSVCPLKRSDQKFDPGNLMAIANSGLLRFYGFVDQDLAAREYNLTVRHGRGKPTSDALENVKEELGLDKLVASNKITGVDLTKELYEKL